MPVEMLWAGLIRNPIHDTRMYQVEFTKCKITELIANIIAESMGAQCDVDGNEYLLLDLLGDNDNDNKALSLTEQSTSTWGGPVTHKTTAGWQCAAGQTKYLLLDLLLDKQNDDKVMSLSNLQVTVQYRIATFKSTAG